MTMAIVIEFLSARKNLTALIATGLVATTYSPMALSADQVLAASTTSFNCSGLAPGDTVTLSAGTRGPLKISSCAGTASNPIVIRNDPRGTGPAVIRRSSGDAGGFVVECANCVGVAFDGSGKWSGAPSGTTYGIKVTMSGGGSPTAFIMLTGASKFVTIKNVEVDGVWPSIASNGIGIHVKDAERLASNYPNAWVEGITLDNNFIHDTEGEGVYIGPNWYEGNPPLRNIIIRNNRIEDTGWDGIQLKAAISGTNAIYGNTLRRVGVRSDSSSKGQLFGISLLDSTGSIHGNLVENAGDTAIQHYLQYLPESYGNQLGEIYNNVVVAPGRVGLLAGNGIATGNSSGAARAISRVYNNTVVGATATGILIGGSTASGFARDNLVADAAESALTTPPSVSKVNNRIGTSSQMGFVSASTRNYRLQSTSPARNAGSASHPPVDFDGIARPQDGTSDQGAFEFDTGDNPKPNPPDLVEVK